jgi:hypothetical protein
MKRTTMGRLVAILGGVLLAWGACFGAWSCHAHSSAEPAWIVGPELKASPVLRLVTYGNTLQENAPDGAPVRTTTMHVCERGCVDALSQENRENQARTRVVPSTAETDEAYAGRFELLLAKLHDCLDACAGQNAIDWGTRYIEPVNLPRPVCVSDAGCAGRALLLDSVGTDNITMASGNGYEESDGGRWPAGPLVFEIGGTEVFRVTPDGALSVNGKRSTLTDRALDQALRQWLRAVQVSGH